MFSISSPVRFCAPVGRFLVLVGVFLSAAHFAVPAVYASPTQNPGVGVAATASARPPGVSVPAGFGTPAASAPVRNVDTVHHGVTVPDPYRYMENVTDPEVLGWMRAQAKSTREVLDRLPIRAHFQKRLEELSVAAGDQIGDLVRMPGDRIYYLKRARNERQFKLMLRIGLQGPERVLIDPEEESQRTGIPHAINYFVPAWDGRHLAYGMSSGGSEDAALYVIETQRESDPATAQNRLIAGPISRVHGGRVHWHPDSRSLTYNQLKLRQPGEPETEFYLDSQVMWLPLGDTVSKPVFGPTVTRTLGLDRLDVAEVFFSPDSQWMVARTTDTTLPEGKVFVAPIGQLGQQVIAWRQVSGFSDAITQVKLKGDDLYFLTHHNAPRNRVVRVNLVRLLASPTPLVSAEQPKFMSNLLWQSASEVAAPLANEVLEGFALTQDALVAEIRQGTQIRLRRHVAGEAAGVMIDLEFPGAARMHGDPAHAYTDVLYTLSGWTQAPLTFRWDGQRSTDTMLRPRIAALSQVEVVVLDLLAPSHDGALVPMTVLHRKGLVLDGKNPTLLNGYGAYGFSQTARFSSAELAWIEQGGVIALANVRGSGVYGRDWYQGGFKSTKRNTWLDGIACARLLIERGFASPQTLAVSGGSAGGIFAGRAMSAAPELFAAAILYVGVLDAVRAEESANGITNISEFGTVKDSLEFKALLEMSTFHQIRDGVAYPAVMLVHGLNDPRVDVWNSAKTAARLQAASNSQRPILLRLDEQAGHGMGSTATQRRGEQADVYAFLLWQMGKTSLARN